MKKILFFMMIGVSGFYIYALVLFATGTQHLRTTTSEESTKLVSTKFNSTDKLLSDEHSYSVDSLFKISMKQGTFAPIYKINTCSTELVYDRIAPALQE